MNRRDALVIIGVLLLAAIAFFALRAPRAAAGYINVYVQNALYTSVPASAFQTICIDQGDGKINEIRIDQAGVRMAFSTCKNQNCVQQGTIDPARQDELALQNWIVCLPNGVTVELSQTEGAQ